MNKSYSNIVPNIIHATLFSRAESLLQEISEHGENVVNRPERHDPDSVPHSGSESESDGIDHTDIVINGPSGMYT